MRIGLIDADGPALFAAGKAAFIIDGDWRVGAYLTDASTGKALIDPKVQGSDYELTPQALARFRELLAVTTRSSTFGNGRFARNTLEAAIGAHAWRLRVVEAPTIEQLRELLAEDLDQDDQGDPA